MNENGINKDVINFDKQIIQKIIMEYTAESGVRNLERAIGSVCRTVAYDYAISKDQKQFIQKKVDQ